MRGAGCPYPSCRRHRKSAPWPSSTISGSGKKPCAVMTLLISLRYVAPVLGSTSVALEGLHRNPSSLTAFSDAFEEIGMSGLDPSEYTLNSKRSPGNGVPVEPGSWAAMVVLLAFTPPIEPSAVLLLEAPEQSDGSGAQMAWYLPYEKKKMALAFVLVVQDRCRLVLEDDVVRVLVAEGEARRCRPSSVAQVDSVPEPFCAM